MSTNNKKTEADRIVLPATLIPGFRTDIAIQNGVERNLLFRTWGGLGDELCTEPTLRYALKMFKGCDISLYAARPELFEHLKFKRVFDAKVEKPIFENYLCFDTIVSPDHLVWQFMSHCLTHCVDFTSLCALRLTLPNADKELRCPNKHNWIDGVSDLLPEKRIAIHAGRHWPSKTFPKDWWDEVICGFVERGYEPILVGAETDDNRGTVDVITGGCLDLRGKLSIRDSILILQQTQVLITNDSAPLHMAATGNAWIGFIATCKHPDYITHWRHGEFGWRMQNLGLGGMWDGMDFCPNKKDEVTVEFVDEAQLRKWLPKPEDVCSWAISRL